jgi:hypothetical protein
MSARKKHPRGLTDRLVTSGLLQVFGLDVLLVVAVAAIGASVYRLSPDLVWGYAGVILLVIWWSIGEARAKADAESKATK